MCLCTRASAALRSERPVCVRVGIIHIVCVCLVLYILCVRVSSIQSSERPVSVCMSLCVYYIYVTYIETCVCVCACVCVCVCVCVRCMCVLCVCVSVCVSTWSTRS